MPRSKPSNFLDELLKREYKDKIYLSKKIVNDRLKVAQNLYNKNFLAHYGCVNAIEFLNGGQFLASGGDDRRVLLWNVQEALQGVGTPKAMRAQHVSNIFCIGYDSRNTRLFSAGNDDQVIVHDIQTGDPVDFFLYEQPVYGLSVDPCNDYVFASACDDGKVLIYDIRIPASTEPFLLARCVAAFHGVMYNPVESRLLATANAKEGACLWDVRSPHQPLLRYGSPDPPQSCMSVRWNSSGSQLLALRRRLPPVLYSVQSSSLLAQFDHPGYFNSCTMKSCCFAGYDDEYVLSGSDDFNLYMWKIPSSHNTKGAWVSSAHVVLGGHRSIVNQVRFNADNFLIASSGVEKLIKVWSPFPLPLSSGGLEKDVMSSKKRKVFSHEEYISLVMRSGQIITHDYSQESTKEDPRMMAFFDSLVQREIEGWSSDESRSDSMSSPLFSDQSISDSSGKRDDDDDDEEEEGDDDDDDNGGGGGDVTGDNGNNEVELNDVSVSNSRGRTVGHSRRRKNKSNPILKLIAKKRAQLMRLAKNNQSVEGSTSGNTSVRDCNNAASRISSASNSSISSNNSSSSSNSSSGSNHSSNDSDDNEIDNVRNKSKKRKRMRKSRKRKRSNYFVDHHSVSSDGENKENPDASKNEADDKFDKQNELKRHFKKRKILIKLCGNGKYDKDDEAEGTPVPSTSTLLESSVSTVSHDDLNTSASTTPDSQTVREGETQDSGIFLSDSVSINNNRSPKKLSSKHLHRNYRKHVINSDSD
ncbi:DDB1- and CUL4-associated factor 5 [Lycorma delicatula]|uniref:DDB1- and CUL4-associated factor 5 n=1 Tax=Lycorma delicatula TaxID=130591 RepID=UPI003F510DE0